MRYGRKWPEYAKQWDRMRIVRNASVFEHDAKFAISHKPIYSDIELRSGVKWYHVAVLHRRESNADFGTYLGNGEPLRRVTRLVPKGRGPWLGANAFIDGALDALKIDGLTQVKDWRLEKILFYCELFNGAGYDMRGLPSPYVWGGTNIQKPGKYVADGRFNSTVLDPQPGCAPLLWMIAKFDPSVTFERET